MDLTINKASSFSSEHLLTRRVHRSRTLIIVIEIVLSTTHYELNEMNEILTEVSGQKQSCRMPSSILMLCRLHDFNHYL